MTEMTCASGSKQLEMDSDFLIDLIVW